MPEFADGLAQFACSPAGLTCDANPPATRGAWGGALGGLGTIGANSGTGAVTCNAGGFAAGFDRLERFPVD